MASRFDPSGFIEAERSRAVATPARDFAWPVTSLKPAQNRHLRATVKPALATIATLAGVADHTLPWAAELADFVSLPCPEGIQSAAWSRLRQQAWDISRQWGAKAMTLGWRSIDLFGCNPVPAAGRLDRDGLVTLIAKFVGSVRVTALTDSHAEITGKDGSTMRFHPPTAAGAVFLWGAYRPTRGP